MQSLRHKVASFCPKSMCRQLASHWGVLVGVSFLGDPQNGWFYPFWFPFKKKNNEQWLPPKDTPNLFGMGIKAEVKRARPPLRFSSRQVEDKRKHVLIKDSCCSDLVSGTSLQHWALHSQDVLIFSEGSPKGAGVFLLSKPQLALRIG